MNRRALERMIIEKKLRRALERREFTLYYQPQMDLRTMRLIGAEALLRWKDPESGEMIPPARFIPIAEENGMIAPIGEWVLREACRQMAEWRNIGDAGNSGVGEPVRGAIPPEGPRRDCARHPA